MNFLTFCLEYTQAMLEKEGSIFIEFWELNLPKLHMKIRYFFINSN